MWVVFITCNIMKGSNFCLATATRWRARRRTTPTSACTGHGAAKTIREKTTTRRTRRQTTGCRGRCTETDFNDLGTRQRSGRITAEDTENGNYSTRALDSNTRHGIRCPLSSGVFRCARGVASFHHLVSVARIHSRPGTLPQGLPPYDGCPRLGCCADRSVCHLSVVSRRAAAEHDRPRYVSATPADVQSHDHWLALAWDGVEGACCLVRSHLDHDGSVCLNPVWPRSQEPSTAPRRSALLCRGLVCCCGDRGFLRRND